MMMSDPESSIIRQLLIMGDHYKWLSVVLLLSVANVLHGQGTTCDANGPRRDCGHVGTQQPDCEAKGCCWSPKDNNPWCFYKNGGGPSSAYIVEAVSVLKNGIRMTLKTNTTDGKLSSPFGTNISPLAVSVLFETNERLHIKIFDPNNKRWEIPSDFTPIPDPSTSAPSSMLYNFKVSERGQPFAFSVIRADDSSVLFDSSVGEGLQFADQYLSIGTSLPSDSNIYGLGEHVTPYLRLQPRTITMWNFDTATPQFNNLYGSHPFYLDLRSTGKAHGVFLRNSNGMDVVLDQSSLTYNVIGGVLDFYFFLGPKPESVIEQYHEVIGQPHMPPYWALGFHQCRYGYPNVQAIEEVVQKYQENQIPLDTMWTDIDYMDQYKDFTLDPQNFPKAEMNKFVSNLHSNGQQYVVIVDPGIKNEEGYSPYDDGVKAGIFVKDKDGNIFTGKVWPGITAFPDFFNPAANSYWSDQLANFHSMLPVDGIWIDMNEISNFCTGECKSDTNSFNRSNSTKPKPPYRFYSSTFDPNNPPYAIHNQGGTTPLNVKTLDMDATHHNGILEYDVHNLFGLGESIATDMALEKLLKKRSLVISRSTFPGSGRVAGHWTGDNHASFDDLYTSIPDILNFQMYGIPLIGADICGFIGDTNEELCSRWMELGAFYPFSRNHNNKGSQPQEPYTWSSVAAISRKVLGIRYSLLPYYYTLFYNAHVPSPADAPSATVWRPVFFEFPTDSKTYDISKQVMIGRGIMLSPVLDEGATSVQAYFPSGSVWYDFYTLTMVSSGGETKTIDAPKDFIPIHLRGGSIIPMQQPALTTSKTRENPFALLVCLDSEGSASGDLYWDDGSTITMDDYQYNQYTVSGGSLTSSTSKVYSGDMPLLTNVTIAGVSTAPTSVSLNQQTISSYTYNGAAKSLMVTVSTSMKKKFKLTWT